MRHRLPTTLAAFAGAVAVAVAVVPAPAQAAAPGFDLEFVDAPGSFTAGGGREDVRVEVSTDRRRPCLKVRWIMQVRAEGFPINQVAFRRIEEDRDFPTRQAAQGDTAQIADAQPDPGQVCGDDTVEAPYQFEVKGEQGGRIEFRAVALDVGGRPLAQSSRTVTVQGEQRRTAEPTPSTASPSPTEDDDDASAAPSEPAEPSDGGGGGDATVSAPPPDPQARVSGTDDDSNLLLPGLAVGAVLVFAGVALLVRLRARTRQASAAGDLGATSHYPIREDPGPSW